MVEAARDRGFHFNLPDIPVIVLTTPSRARMMRSALDRRRWVAVVEMDGPAELPVAFAKLRRQGIARISCIGGRTIATALLDAGLVDDVHLTTSPRAGGKPGTPMYPRPLGDDSVVRKRGTHRSRVSSSSTSIWRVALHGDDAGACQTVSRTL